MFSPLPPPPRPSTKSQLEEYFASRTEGSGHPMFALVRRTPLKMAQGGRRNRSAPRPRAPRAGRDKKPVTVRVRATGEREKKRKGTGKEEKKKNARVTPAPRGPSKAEGQNSQRKGEAHQNAPARPAQAQAQTRGTRAWRPPTRKGRCWRAQETAPVHQPSPLSEDGRYRKPDASVTGSTHAKPPQCTQPKTEAGWTPQAQPRCGAPNE